MDAYNRGDWQAARDDFRTAIGLEPEKCTALYLALLHSCIQSQDWNQVSFVSERIAYLFPEYKNEIAYDYGMALYHQMRYADAIPWLKRALACADQPVRTYVPAKSVGCRLTLDNPQRTLNSDGQPGEPLVLPPLNTMDVLSYENAIKSEEIVLATYESYEKEAFVSRNLLSPIITSPRSSRDRTRIRRYQSGISSTMKSVRRRPKVGSSMRMK